MATARPRGSAVRVRDRVHPGVHHPAGQSRQQCVVASSTKDLVIKDGSVTIHMFPRAASRRCGGQLGTRSARTVQHRAPRVRARRERETQHVCPARHRARPLAERDAGRAERALARPVSRLIARRTCRWRRSAPCAQRCPRASRAESRRSGRLSRGRRRRRFRRAHSRASTALQLTFAKKSSRYFARSVGFRYTLHACSHRSSTTTGFAPAG